MLLIIEALLLISAALLQDHGAATHQTFPLGMERNSVDDQYRGCKDKMSHLVKTKYLKREMEHSHKFKYYWQNSANTLKYTSRRLTRSHLIAIRVYTGKYVYRLFNDDTRNGKKQYKHHTFKWNSLHFLLTEAVQILKKTQNKCHSTYRGTTADFDKHVLNKEIRFGSFTSSSLNRAITKRFGSKSCFEIITCQSAELTKYSLFPSTREVLIPPYETFRVTAVRTRQFYPTLWCDTVYNLQSTGRKSYMNCALLKKH